MNTSLKRVEVAHKQFFFWCQQITKAKRLSVFSTPWGLGMKGKFVGLRFKRGVEVGYSEDKGVGKQISENNSILLFWEIPDYLIMNGIVDLTDCSRRDGSPQY